MATAAQGAISKKRKFVADGVFYAELNEFFQRELAEEGYSGVEVRVTPTVTDISTALISQKQLLVLTVVQSSAQHTPRKCSASKAVASVNLPPSSKSVSSSPRTASPSMPPRSRTVVSPPSLNASPYDTSF